MKVKQVIVFLMSFILISEGLAVNFVPVKNTSERVSGIGLSTLPPQGEDWYIAQGGSSGEVHYMKMVETPLHTFGCDMYIIPTDKDFKSPDDFLEFVKQGKESDTDPERFKNLSFKYNLDDRYGSYCVEYKLKATDIKVKTPNGKGLVFEIFGYAFIHPKSSKYLVDIQYSERGINEEFTQSLQKIGEEFIDSLIIEE